jgi:hypothetical protein
VSGGGASPQIAATAAASCTVRSPVTGGPSLEFTAIRFPVGGARHYSGFPTAAQTYDACAKKMLRAYNAETTQLREQFTVDFGDRATGAYDSGVSRDDQPVIDSATVCVLSGNDSIEVKYGDGAPDRPAAKESLKRGATLAAAETLRNLP